MFLLIVTSVFFVIGTTIVSPTKETIAGGSLVWPKTLWSTSKNDVPQSAEIHGSSVYVAGALFKDRIVDNAKQLMRVSKHDLNGVYYGKIECECVNAIQGDVANAESVTTDTNGNVYVGAHARCISWNEKLRFKVYDAYGNKIGQETIHVKRFEAEGILLKLWSDLRIQWIKELKSGDETKILGVASSPDNNYVYAAGHYKGSRLKMDGNTYLYNKGNFDVFVAKYSAWGSPIAAIGIGGTDDDGKAAITTDAWGNIYVTGYFRSSTLYIYNKYNILATIQKVSSGSDVFVVKLTPSFNVAWVKAFGGPGDDRGTAIATGVGSFANDIYVTGFFENWMYLPGVGYLCGSGDRDAYGVLLTSNGNIGGGIKIGGPGQERGLDIKVVPNTGRIYITGFFGSSSLQVGSYTVYSKGGHDAFLVELDRYGNVYALGTAGGSGTDEGTALATTNGIVIVAGTYTSNPLYIGSYPLYKYGSNADAFFLRLNHYA